MNPPDKNHADKNTPDKNTSGKTDEPWLHIEDLTAKRGGKEVLKGIDLQVFAGELIAIVGANGSGKSTLLATLLGQVEATAGTVRVDNQSITRFSHQQRAQSFAWLPQESPTAEPLLVEEVVAAARYHMDEPRPDALKEARAALEECGAGDLSTRWWNELSGGERQRVELATLKAQGAKAWLLDEPANHLDPIWRSRLLEELQRRVLEGTTVVVVLHDISLLEELNEVQPRVVALAEGRVIYDGKDPQELGEDWRSRVWSEDRSGGPTVDSEAMGRKPWGATRLLVWGVLTMLIGMASAWIGPQISGELGQAILHELRIPRAVAGMIMGAVLAGAGAVLQILLQNPLATPGTVGTTAGASLGVILALLFGVESALFGIPLLPLAAFAGALTVTSIIVLVASRHRTRTEDVLLAGIALTLMTGAISSALRLGFDQVMALDALRWSLGSLTLIGFERLWLALPFLLVSMLGMLMLLRPLDVLVTGIDRAGTRGVNVPRIRTWGVGLASLGVAAGVAMAGPIAFVGLVCPHIMRLWGGGQPRFLVPASMCLGLAFLPLCDSLGRVLLDQREVPVGVITAAIGAPLLFLLVVRRSRQR